MKMKRVGSPPGPVIKLALLQKKDAAEYERTRDEIIQLLEKMGGYVPAIDNIHVDEIARIAIYAKKIEIYLDSGTVDVDIYSRVTDMKLKLSKIIDNALHQLALARRDRMSKQTESSLMNELREAMLRGLKAGEQ